MSYRSVTHDLREYLGGITLPPDSVITSPFDVNQVFLGAIREFVQGMPDVQVVIREVSGKPNPKWMRDEWIVGVQTLGKDASKYMECENTLGEIVHSLVGSPTVYIGDRAYVQFGSNQLPMFVGYLDNSKPLFSATITFVVEGLEDKYNRKALC